MQRRITLKSGAIAIVLALVLGMAAQASVNFVTAIGGASGMTTQLSPYATEGVVRGCAPQIMDIVLKYRDGSGTGTVNYAYSAARMEAKNPDGTRNDAWSEPKSDDPNWKSGQVKFTGDKSPCEVSWITDINGNIHYAMVLRSDSVLGIRWACNRQKIYSFVPLSGSNTWVNAQKVAMDTAGNAAWAAVLTDINDKLANGGISIEGGLSECYMDSAVRAIDKFNRLFPAPTGGIVQPQLNSANFATTKENSLAIAVCAVIYNKYIQEQWNGNQAVGFGVPELKLITGGKVDSWDFFFSSCTEPIADHKRVINYFREPLSGTSVTYLYETMRGVEKEANGSVMSQWYDQRATIPDSAGVQQPNPNYNTWVNVNIDTASGINYHTSGIPGLTCQQDPTSKSAPNAKPGSGAVNTGVNMNYGGIGYTFLQRFTQVNSAGVVTVPSGYSNIRVAKVNGAEPYPFDMGDNPGDENSIPGINGSREVTSPPAGKSFYQSVVDGKYPLWAYNHVFDATNGTSPGLNDFIARFTQTANAPIVRSVGLLPVSDMDTYAQHRSVPTTGPNANRGPGFGRCGFVSPLTGEIVRDGMAIMPKWNDGTLPGEGFVDQRP